MIGHMTLPLKLCNAGAIDSTYQPPLQHIPISKQFEIVAIDPCNFCVIEDKKGLAIH